MIGFLRKPFSTSLSIEAKWEENLMSLGIKMGEDKAAQAAKAATVSAGAGNLY